MPRGLRRRTIALRRVVEGPRDANDEKLLRRAAVRVAERALDVTLVSRKI